MAKGNSDIKAALRRARKIIEDIYKLDANEAETRQRVERIFESVTGYDVFTHLSREHAVRGAGNTEHMDFAIKLKPDKVSIVVELKRVGVDLSKKHLKQASHYAIDLGCEWVLLTNGREWEIYHVEFAQPPETTLVQRWNLLQDDWSDLAESFDLISLRNMKKGTLAGLWEKQSALTPECLLSQILSEDSIRRLKNAIRKEAGVSVHPEDIVAAIRKLFNERAGSLMDQMKISLPERKPKPRQTKTTEDAQPAAGQASSGTPPSAAPDEPST